jgi:DNA-binding NtrC family response regulator
MPRLLLIDDDESIRAGIAALLETSGWSVVGAGTAGEGMKAFDREWPDVLLLDVGLPDASGLDVLAHVKAETDAVPVVMLSGAATIDIAVEAMRLGAETFIQKPAEGATLEAVLGQASRTSAARRQIAALERSTEPQGEPLAGESQAMALVREIIERVAPAPSPVLLLGESGTGKGLAARALHQRSRVARGPWVDLNCAGLPRDLLESELFGHERGAFTGAHAAKQGLLEIASGGTLFLDEIGELDVSHQARLLKVLEQKTFRRVGGVRDIRVDLRLIAATNRDLQIEVAAGRFRADLYYRLNVVSIHLPPLRERLDDIPTLSLQILGALGPELRRPGMRISERAIARLQSYSWPGNVRELRNVLERAILVSNGREIVPGDLLLGSETAPRRPGNDGPENEWDIRPLDEVMTSYIAKAVQAARGNMRLAARRLRISPSTLYARYRKEKREP